MGGDKQLGHGAGAANGRRQIVAVLAQFAVLLSGAFYQCLAAQGFPDDPRHGDAGDKQNDPHNRPAAAHQPHKFMLNIPPLRQRKGRTTCQ